MRILLHVWVGDRVHIAYSMKKKTRLFMSKSVVLLFTGCELHIPFMHIEIKILHLSLARIPCCIYSFRHIVDVVASVCGVAFPLSSKATKTKRKV